MNLTKILTWLACIFIFVFVIPSYQRSYFGNFYGNVLIVLETISIVLVFAAWRIFIKGDRNLSLIFTKFAGALALLCFGWISHPDSIASFYEARLSDIEKEKSEFLIFGIQNNEAENAEKNYSRLQRIDTELYSRKVEYDAAVYRHKNSPELHNDPLKAYIFFGLFLFFISDAIKSTRLYLLARKNLAISS